MGEHDYLFEHNMLMKDVENVGAGLEVKNTPEGFYVLKDGKELRFVKAKSDAPYCVFRLSCDGKRLYYHRLITLYPGKYGKSYPATYYVPEEISIYGDGIEYDSARPGKWSAVSGEKDLSFYYSIDGSKRMNIAMEYFIRKTGFEIIPNEFDDDTTINVVVKTNTSDTKECDFLRFLGEPLSLSIHGIPVDTILHSVTRSRDYQWSRYKFSTITGFTDEMDEACEYIFAAVKEKHGFSDNEAAQYLFDNYVIHDWRKRECVLQDYLHVHDKHAVETRDLYDQLDEEIMEDKKNVSNWKNEFKLYKLIKKDYADAIYHYYLSLRECQSLSVYVPSINTGFVFQGNRNGSSEVDKANENAYVYRHDLNDKCQAAGIRLIEWSDSEPITKKSLKKKM